jgi:hypothetical protein
MKRQVQAGKYAPTIGSSSVHFEKNLLKYNVTAQTEWNDTRALDWPHEASGLFGWNHCCPGLAHKIRHFREKWKIWKRSAGI